MLDLLVFDLDERTRHSLKTRNREKKLEASVDEMLLTWRHFHNCQNSQATPRKTPSRFESTGILTECQTQVLSLIERSLAGPMSDIGFIEN